MKLLFGLFLIAHAFIHSSFLSKEPPQKPGAPAWPFDLTNSWILSPAGVSPDMLKIIGVILTLAVTVGFIASGLGWLGVPFLKDIWVSVTVASSIASILFLIIFWNSWLVMGPIIDLVILYFIFFKNLKP